MKANFAMLALFHTERPLQFVIERDGANQAFVDISKCSMSVLENGMPATKNPHEKNTPEYTMWLYGYTQYFQYHISILSTLAEQKTTHQRKNAFGGTYAS